MGEPQLLTEKAYYQYWKQYNPLSQGFNELQEYLLAVMFVIGFNAVIAINTYYSGHSRSGPIVMNFFLVVLAVSVVFYALAEWRKRRRYALWKQYFPYDPEQEFTTEDFRKAV